MPAHTPLRLCFAAFACPSDDVEAMRRVTIACYPADDSLAIYEQAVRAC